MASRRLGAGRAALAGVLAAGLVAAAWSPGPADADSRLSSKHAKIERHVEAYLTKTGAWTGKTKIQFFSPDYDPNRRRAGCSIKVQEGKKYVLRDAVPTRYTFRSAEGDVTVETMAEHPYTGTSARPKNTLKYIINWVVIAEKNESGKGKRYLTKLVNPQSDVANALRDIAELAEVGAELILTRRNSNFAFPPGVKSVRAILDTGNEFKDILRKRFLTLEQMTVNSSKLQKYLHVNGSKAVYYPLIDTVLIFMKGPETFKIVDSKLILNQRNYDGYWRNVQAYNNPRNLDRFKRYCLNGKTPRARLIPVSQTNKTAYKPTESPAAKAKRFFPSLPTVSKR